jgi:hypothetical protein
MIDHLLFGAQTSSINQLGEWVLRGLAVAGGATVGGFGTGLLMQLIARLTVAKPLPKPAVNVLRILGALVAGCLVWMWVFGSGGPGFGLGGGGGRFGLGGHETGAGGTGAGKNTDSGMETARSDGTDPTVGPGVLRVEVLGDRPEERERFYRLENSESKTRLTMKELQARINERKTQAPPLQTLVIVLYLDSPDKDKLQVRELQELALDLKLPFVIVTMNRKAPPGA